MSVAVSYFEALAITEVIEAPIYVAILSRAASVRKSAALVASIVVNLVSHPLFSFVLVPVADRAVSPEVAVMAGELVVCVLEAALIFAWLRRQLSMVVVASLVANSLSFAAGLALFR